jgi:predicted PurR-regulated permease PerM
MEDAARVNRVLLNLAAFVVIVAGMRAASDLLVPFLLAVFLGILCATPLRWLSEHHVPRVLGVILIVLVILSLGTVLGGLLGTTIFDFTRSIPQYEAGIQAQLTNLQNLLGRFGVEVSRQVLNDYFDPSRLFGLAGTLVTSLGQVLTNGALILLTMVFILLEMSGFQDKIRVAFGEDDATEAEAGFQQVGMSIRRYVALKTVISLGTGVLIAVWLAAIGVDYAILWGVLAFLLNYIPNIGSFVAAIPAVLLAGLTLGLGSAVVTALGYLVVNVLMANILEPRVMGYGVGLSTLVVFVSLVFWGWVLGPVGMLLSVPLTVIFRIVLQTNDSTRWMAVLLGSERSLGLVPAGAEGAASESAPPVVARAAADLAADG